MKNFLEKKRSGEWASRQGKKKEKTKRAMRVGIRTSEKTVKWNQMTTLGFQTRWRHQTFPASLRETDRARKPNIDRAQNPITIYTGAQVCTKLSHKMGYNAVYQSWAVYSPDTRSEVFWPPRKQFGGRRAYG